MPPVSPRVPFNVRRIVLVGACAVDHIMSVPHYPVEDEKLRCSKFNRRRGGNTPNTAEVLQQLLESKATTEDIGLQLITVLPEQTSAASKFIADSFGKSIRLGSCIYRAGYSEPVSSYIISNSASDTRTCITHNELPDMTFEEFKQIIERLSAERSTDTLVHFEGRNIDVVKQCMQYLREQTQDPSASKFVISIEFEKPGRPGLWDLGEFADIIFVSKAFAKACDYTSARDCVSGVSGNFPRAQFSVCTWGDQGAAVGDRETEDKHLRVTMVAAREATVVDPVGVGDTFIAGFLWEAYCHGQMLSEAADCLIVGNELAARKIAQDGFASLVRSDEDWVDMVASYQPRVTVG